MTFYDNAKYHSKSS